MPQAFTQTGTRDAHLHLAEYGESLEMVALGDCASVDAVLQRIAAASNALPMGRWVRAAGMRTEALRERRSPTAAELHDASGGRCVLARSFDHHAMAVSKAVLKLAGIDGATPDPPGGVIPRGAVGQPTGLLLERACDAVWRVVPPVGDDEYRGWVVTALRDLSRRGVVEVHDMLARERLVRVLHALEREGRLNAGVRLYATPEHFEAVRSASAGTRSERIAFAGLKLFADGTLNSRTAFMLTDYAQPLPGSPRGKQLLSREAISASLARARTAGVGLAVHAIGDAAVRTVLDAVESCGVKARAVPGLDAVRIEHAQFVDHSDVPRFARLGVVASPQPCHLLTDIEAINRLMAHRAGRAFPIRDLVEAYRHAGMDPVDWVWFGSDAPVVPPAPADNVQAAVHRCRANQPGMVIAREQAVPESLAHALMKSPNGYAAILGA